MAGTNLYTETDRYAWPPVWDRVSLAGILFVAWVLCGKISLNRLLEQRAEGWPNIELRWIFLIAIICLISSRFRLEIIQSIGLRIYVSLILAFFGIYFFCMLYNSPVHLEYIFDALTILLQIAFLLYFLQSNRNAEIIVSCTIIVLGYLLLVFFVFGIGTDIDQSKWAFGTSYTFHRIQFLSAASLIYLATRTNWNLFTVTYFFLATINLYFAWYSFSKISVVLSTLCMLMMAFLFLIKREWKLSLALLMTMALVIVSATFSVEFMKYFQNRFKAWGHIEQTKSLEPEWIQTPEKTGSYYTTGSLSKLMMTYCVYNQPETDNISDADCKAFQASDWSGRILLFSEALLKIRQSPWLGTGPGNFIVTGNDKYLGTRIITQHPHNIVLEVLLGTGVIGFIAFWATLVVGGGMPLLHVNLLSCQYVPFLGMVAYIFGVAQFSGDMYDFRLFWLSTIIILAQTPVLEKSGRIH